MAKQRNSLGIQVLPVPSNETLTWEQYKERYGIDLEKIFEVVDQTSDPDNPSYGVYFKTSFSKIIVLSYPQYAFKEVPSVAIPSFDNTTAAIKASASAIMSVTYGADFDGGHQILVFGNKTIHGGDI